MSYKDKLYSKYVSTQTSCLYGVSDLRNIQKQFSVWKTYFGKFLPEDKTAKILDFGCGNGSFVYWLQQIGYKNTEGIDVSEEQVETAKNLGIENINRVSDISTTNKYDVIFMKDVLEHFDKDEILNLLEKTRRSLKDNSFLIIQAPNAESLFSGRFRYGDFTHEISFTENSIRQILLVSGFKNVSVYPMPPVIHGFKSFVRSILWKIIEKIRYLLDYPERAKEMGKYGEKYAKENFSYSVFRKKFEKILEEIL